jgi:RNA polymerase sigma factor (sigma-70 family)
VSQGNSAPPSILEELRSSQSRECWAEFLRQYGPLIFQTCHFSTSDADDAAECFLFACQQLSRNRFRRLLKFRPDGAASFPTWLRVVVRNLCLDWRRKQFGRWRMPRSIARLPQLEGQVYTCRYERGLSLDETFFSLCPSFPGLTMQRLIETEAQVQNSLTSRQRWLIGTHQTQAQAAVRGSAPSAAGVCEGDAAPATEPVDPRPSQEVVLAQQEQETHLRSALEKLDAPERLLIRLRFEEELSLQQIARLTGLGDAQRVHRRIEGILGSLRKKLT